jgi:hypothetical protein
VRPSVELAPQRWVVAGVAVVKPVGKNLVPHHGFGPGGKGRLGDTTSGQQEQAPKSDGAKHF